MEKAGEGAFPLSKRWDRAGKNLLEALPLCVNRLWNVVLSMLKGMMVKEAQAGDNDDGIGVRIGWTVQDW